MSVLKNLLTITIFLLAFSFYAAGQPIVTMDDLARGEWKLKTSFTYIKDNNDYNTNSHWRTITDDIGLKFEKTEYNNMGIVSRSRGLEQTSQHIFILEENNRIIVFWGTHYFEADTPNEIMEIIKYTYNELIVFSAELGVDPLTREVSPLSKIKVYIYKR